VLSVNRKLGIAHNVDEQDMRNLEPDFLFNPTGDGMALVFYTSPEAPARFEKLCQEKEK